MAYVLSGLTAAPGGSCTTMASCGGGRDGLGAGGRVDGGACSPGAGTGRFFVLRLLFVSGRASSVVALLSVITRAVGTSGESARSRVTDGRRRCGRGSHGFVSAAPDRGALL